MNTFESDNTDVLLREYTTLEYILLGDLRDLLEESAGPENRKWLAAVLDALLETLPREMALREEGGYLSDVLDEFPNWSDQVDQLHDEHTALYTNLQQLRSDLAREDPVEETAAVLRHRLREWMSAFTAHHRHERRLVQTAFNLDVGPGD